MSSAAARTRTSRSRRSARRRSSARWRRRAALAVGTLVAGIAALFLFFSDAVREITLPLRHDDIIRQQARDKGLDPALIAAIIYEESRFRDQTSHAGARGLMQITPETARFIARDSGGTEFVEGDLATPQINIAYGSYFLRYLLERYDGDRELAVAAYNAGETNVNQWLTDGEGNVEVDDIPFPETRAYVNNVLERRDEYAEHYADDLGL
jgi:soluble lytic murein transglycosylase